MMAQPDAPLSSLLRTNPVLHQSLVRTLGGGGSGISARWWKVAVELSKHNKQIDLHWIQDIEANHSFGPARATAFLAELADTLRISARTFSSALRAAGLEVSSDEVALALAAMLRGPQGPTHLIVQSSQPAVEWRQRWTTICIDLCHQLPVDALSALQTAFNCYGATSVQHFFEIKNSANFFTGSSARRNCTDLLSVLSTWRDVDAVRQLSQAVDTM